MSSFFFQVPLTGELSSFVENTLVESLRENFDGLVLN